MAFIVMGIANSKGYEQSFGWFVYGLMIWPVALIHSLILENRIRHQGHRDSVPESKRRNDSEGSSIIILPESSLLVGRDKKAELASKAKTKLEVDKKKELERTKKLLQEEKRMAKILLLFIIVFGFSILLLAINTAG